MKKNELLLKKINEDMLNFFIDEESVNEESFLCQEVDDEEDKERERNHLIIIIARNKRIWKWIDRVYETNKYEFYKCYQETFFKDTPLKDGFSTKTKEYINKLAGIDKWCRTHNTEEPILKIIQKSHTKLYSRFKVGIKEFDLDRFIASMLPKMADDYNLVSQRSDLEEIIIVSMYLSRINKVELKGFLWKKVLDLYSCDLFIGVKGKYSNSMILKNLDENEMVKLMEKVLELSYKEIKNCETVEELYTSILVKQNVIAKRTYELMTNTNLEEEDFVEREIIGALLSSDCIDRRNKEYLVENIIEKEAQKINDGITETKMSEIIIRLRNIFKNMGIEKETLLDLKVDVDLIKSSLLNVYRKDIMSSNIDKIKINEHNRFQVLSNITIMSLMDVYKTVQPHSFGQEEEQSLLEIENLNNKLKEKDAEIIALKEKLKNMTEIKNKEIKEALDESDLLKKNIKRMKKEMSKHKENQIEYNAMKEYIYKKSINEDELAITLEDEELTIEEKIDYINEKRIAIFGGHPNWVNKLKKLVPNAMYIDVDSFSSKKFTRLDKYDLLVICRTYISHGLCWKVNEAIKNVAAKKVVIIDSINTSFTINNMYENIKYYEDNK